MEYILLVVIILQFAYAVYKDILYSKERERLSLMIKSKDVVEYSGATEPQPEDGKSVEDPYIPIEEVPFNMVAEAEEKL